MITSLAQLSATSAALAERLLDYAVAPVAPKLRTEIRDAMLAHLCELLDPEATTDEVADAMAALGPVDSGEPVTDTFFTRLLAGARLRGLDERIATTWWLRPIRGCSCPEPSAGVGTSTSARWRCALA